MKKKTDKEQAKKDLEDWARRLHEVEGQIKELRNELEEIYPTQSNIIFKEIDSDRVFDEKQALLQILNDLVLLKNGL